LEFHHRPSAITQTEGAASSSAPWPRANAAGNASQAEWASTPSRRAVVTAALIPLFPPEAGCGGVAFVLRRAKDAPHATGVLPAVLACHARLPRGLLLTRTNRRAALGLAGSVLDGEKVVYPGTVTGKVVGDQLDRAAGDLIPVCRRHDCRRIPQALH